MRQTLKITDPEQPEADPTARVKPPRFLYVCKWISICALFLRLGVVFYAAITSAREWHNPSSATSMNCPVSARDALNAFNPGAILLVTLFQTALCLLALFPASRNLSQNIKTYFKLAFFYLVILHDITVQALLVNLYACVFSSTVSVLILTITWVAFTLLFAVQFFVLYWLLYKLL